MHGRSLADGVDPSAERQQAKRARVHTFEAVAREWLDKQNKRVAESAVVWDRSRLEAFVFPTLSGKPVGKISTAELLACLRKMEAKGIHESVCEHDHCAAASFGMRSPPARPSGMSPQT